MRLHTALVTFLLTLSCAERIDARQVLRIRQDNNAPATTNAPDSTATSVDHATSTPTPAPTSSGNGDAQTSDASSVASGKADATSPITLSGTVSDFLSPTSTVLPGINSTVVPGELPLQPALNPALGVAGVVLMIAGGALGFIGIKHKGTQTFLSTALLVALGIEVLIIYLMHPPVPAGVQGAYLVAGVCGGALLGGLSLIFKEVCEGFGCVLGGFCFAMWLMVLSPGGTIKNNTGMIILIAVFCVAGYCAYISRFTRGYAVIFCTAFAGSTAFVLGIDCFSQAGLKEFWLYIWDLNPNEFPLFTDTYPINRPMRAEIAAIVIVAFLGVMSQIKIWKIVREQKAKRDAQRIQDEEARNQEEEEVGRDIESRNRRSLDHWEGNYDDKKQPSVHVDSGFASLEDISEEREHTSYPLVNMASSSCQDGNLKKLDKRTSSSSLNIFRHSLAPSLPPLAFGAEDNAEDTKAILHEDAASTHGAATTPGTEPPSPGLTRPASTVKDRRGLKLKRLSIRSLRGKDAPPVPSPAPETPYVEEDDDDDVASSIAATAAEPPDADALSVRLSRPNSMYLSFANPPAMPSRESIVEFDPEALNLGRTSTHGGLSPRLEVPKSPGTPAQASNSGSYFGDKSEKSEEKVELADRLPKKMSKVALNYRTNEWAKAISAAEPEPIEDDLVHDPEAVQVEMGDAAESARSKKNNAAPAPPPPPPEPKEVKEVKDAKAEKGKSLSRRMSSGTPTPIYAHASKPSDDSWSVPLAKRTSSNPILAVHSPPRDETPRNVSAPLLEEAVTASPVDVSPIQQRPGSAMRNDARMSRTNSQTQMRPDSRLQRSASQLQMRSLTPNNLMDERRERMENRLTTTSFMSPLVEGSPIISEPTSVTDSSQGDSSEQHSKSTNTSQSGEEMTLAERKALVQQQPAVIQPPTETYQPPSRHPSLQQQQQITQSRNITPTKSPSRPMRMSSTGPQQPLYDSHQPRRTSSHNATKAASNWSQWRSSNALATTSRTPVLTSDSQMDLLRSMRAQTELEARERERRDRRRQESMDQHMRMGGMNGAHRAALARMQGEANKRTTTTGESQ